MNLLIKKFNNLSVQSKASIAYILGNLVSKGIVFLTVPIFTRIMTPHEFGISTVFQSWYSVLYAVVSLSLCSSSLNIAMMEYKDKRDEYQSAILTLSSISACIFAFLYLICQTAIENITTLDSSLIWMLIISMMINPALDSWYIRQRYEYKYKATVIVSVFISFCSSIVAIGAILLCKKANIYNLGNVKVVSQSLVLVCVSMFFYLKILHKGKKYFSISIWKYALVLSVPLIFHALAKNLLDVSDRLMIASFCGKSDAGIYGIVCNISMIALLIWNAINAALIPTIFSFLEKQQSANLGPLLTPVLLFFGIGSILVTLFAPELIIILAPKSYYEAVYLIPALSAGVYFSALYSIYGNLLLFKKKTFNIMLATCLAAFLNILLNFLFIPKYGYAAAAYTTLLSFIAIALFQGVMVRFVYKKKIIEDYFFFILSGIVAFICLACNLLYHSFAVRYILIAILCAVLIANRKKIISKFSKKT